MEYAHGMVAECAVIPSGDALQALILPDEKAIKTRRILNIEETVLDEVVEPYNEHSSSYKRILKCSLVSSALPRTRLGKLKRHELPALASGPLKHHHEDPAPAPRGVEYEVIRQYFTEQTETEISPDDHFELDLALDSLGKVAFLSYLSGIFNFKLPDSCLVDNPTPRKLAAYLQALGATAHPLKQTIVKWGDLLKEKITAKLPKSDWTHRWMNTFSGFFLRCICHLKGAGARTLPQRPFILAPNHQSYLDVLYLMAFLDSDTLENTYFYATAKHLESPLARYVARHHNVIVMDMNGDLKLSIQTLAAALKAGKNIVIFPEGTRSMDGFLGQLKSAFAILSRELNVPVVPVAIDGAFKVLPRGHFWPRLFHHVKVTFLEAIRPEKNDTYDIIVQKVTLALQKTLTPTAEPTTSR